MAQKRKTQTISPAPAARILMNAGAKRVSSEAAKEFAELIHNLALEISERAVMISKHSGRKTVQSGDVKLAVK